MTPYYEDDQVTLYHGDCREILATLADESVAVVLTDPPYSERTHNAARATVNGKIQRSRVHDRDGWKCLHCGTEFDLTLDHIVPWSAGGSDDESNLQTLCRSCNARKGART